MKTISDIKTKIDAINEQKKEVTKLLDEQLKANELDLSMAYVEKFKADKAIQSDIKKVQNSRDLAWNAQGELDQWVRISFDIPDDADELEALKDYLIEEHHTFINRDTDCLLYSIGPCLNINEDGDVYDQDSSKEVIKKDAYDSEEELHALIETYMEKTGHFPSVVRSDHYGNAFYVNTQGEKS